MHAGPTGAMFRKIIGMGQGPQGPERTLVTKKNREHFQFVKKNMVKQFMKPAFQRIPPKKIS